MSKSDFKGRVARFVGHESWLLRRADGSYKLSELAYEPKLNTVSNRMEVSVWAHDGEGRESVPWTEGENYVSSWRTRKGRPIPKLKGIGDLEVLSIQQAQLEVDDLTDEILPLHTNIISWERHQETEWKALSKKLADKSSFYVIESNIDDPDSIKPEFTSNIMLMQSVKICEKEVVVHAQSDSAVG